MDSDAIKVKHSRKRWVWVVAAVAVLAVLALLWQQQRTEERRRQEQLAQAQGIAEVLSATFARQNRLQVGEVRGALDVTSVDPGYFQFLRSTQRVTLPYAVTYTLDLSGLDLSDFRWDAANRTLYVEAPDVQPGQPNIDESRRVLRETEGLWVSRNASENLSRRAAGLATQAATREARSPEQLARARENARDALASLIETPLQAADIGNVDVVVRFPQEGVRNGERWDVSPSIAEVLGRRREAEQTQ